MLRVLSFLLIVGGLVIAGLGLRSIWETREAEQRAQEEWDRQIAARPAPGRAEASENVRPLHRGDMVAKLSIDRLNSEWVVLEGADKDELKLGPGHLVDSALPGSRGNCVIAGHRDTQF